jgi:hypothetical protein
MHSRLRLILTFALLGGTVSCATIDLDTLKRASLVERGFLPRSPGGGGSAELWYSYPHPTDDRSYANVFKLNTGRVIAINLYPQSSDGVHTGDELVVVDVTKPNEPAWLWHTPLYDGADYRFQLRYVDYSLKGVSRNGELFAVVTDFCGTNAVVSVDALHRWRVMAAQRDIKVGEIKYKYLPANSGNLGQGILLFAEKCQAAVLDPAAPRADLLPTYYLIHQKGERRVDNILIGGSGYRASWNGTNYAVELAK